jgi:hypothetical protein
LEESGAFCQSVFSELSNRFSCEGRALLDVLFGHVGGVEKECLALEFTATAKRFKIVGKLDVCQFL